MNHRRLIGSILVLASLAGTFASPARPACALPRATIAVCPGCATACFPGAAPSVSADRSCCAAPSSLADREPATVAPDPAFGSGDARALMVLVPIPGGFADHAAIPAPRAISDPPGASPPVLRTTILVI